MERASLVVAVGDRVTGSGRFVADSDGEWLDLARVETPEFFGLVRPRSPASIRLLGADTATISDHNTIPELASVTGTWLGDALYVESLRPDSPEQPTNRLEYRDPPCSAPAGGWLRGARDSNPEFEVGDLLTSGSAVRLAIFRPSADQAVVVVAASDVERVIGVLGPQLPGGLCVTQSRWSRAQLDAVRGHLIDRWNEWRIRTLSEGADEHAQPYLEVELDWVTADLALWADDLPNGILTLTPSLRPATRA